MLVLAPAAAVAAGAKLQARVDRGELALGERLLLEVTLEQTAPGGAPRWDFPAAPDFEVLDEDQFLEAHGTLGGGAGVQIVEVRTIVRQLRPKRAGALTLPPVSAILQGKRYVTEAIVVQVSGAGPAAPGPGPGAPDPKAGAPGRQAGAGAAPAPRGRGGWAYSNWERDVTLRMEVTKREVWVGEQLRADAWLVGPYEISDFRAEQMPAFDGFWKENLEIPRRLRPEVRGHAWAYLLTRAALFPTRPGPLTVEPLHGTADVAVRGGRFGAFGRLVQVPKRTEPIAVRVKPLPAGAPHGFDPGNVGALTLQLSAAPERVAAGEPVTVRITVAGDGNVRAYAPPRLPDLPGARAYQPTTTDRLEDRGGRLFGTRTVEIVVVPDRAGELVIPAGEWPFFDPRAGKYQVAITPAVRVAVDPPRPAPRDAAPAAPELAARLRPIRADGALRPVGPPPWRRPWFLALLVAPPVAFLAAAAAARLRAGAGARAAAGAGREARRELLAARRRGGRDPAGAAAEAERALQTYASRRLARTAAGLTRDALAAALALAGAHPRAVRALLQALDLADAARYGAGDVRVEEVLAAAERALAALEEADWEPAREVGA